MSQKMRRHFVPRRDFFRKTAAIAASVTAVLATAGAAEGGDASFLNNVPDPVASGKELPNFEFALGKSHGKVIGNSSGKEATVSQLPISKGIAGVSMKLEPGALREYIPQGYGHSIENIGHDPCRILIGFNTGIYQTIDLSQWIAGNPLDVLATNFGKPASLFEKFPHKDVFIADADGH